MKLAVSTPDFEVTLTFALSDFIGSCLRFTLFKITQPSARAARYTISLSVCLKLLIAVLLNFIILLRIARHSLVSPVWSANCWTMTKYCSTLSFTTRRKWKKYTVYMHLHCTVFKTVRHSQKDRRSSNVVWLQFEFIAFAEGEKKLDRNIMHRIRRIFT